MRVVNLVTMLELFCSTPAGITGEVTHASFILARNRQGMFATKASLQFIKQLCSILFYIFCFALEAECFYFAFNWCDRLGLQILFT